MDLTKYTDFAQSTLGVNFDDIELLVTAFTHRSYLNEHKKTVNEHNERLEFLGDAVLELVVTEYLYGNYTEPEGILTNWRSALVRTESIGAAAARCGFEPLLRLSRGEKHGTDRARQQILANGYETAKRFITDNLIVTFKEILDTGSWMDPKSHLQEIVQSNDGFTPEYRVLEEDGPDHDKTFTVGVFVNGKLKGQGSGPSKQIGQQQAAEAALKKYRA
jgi:ribonuclease-3